MLLEGSSDIILRCEYLDSGSYAGTQRLTFRNGFVLVLSVDCLALYKTEASISDPLGNGLKAMAELESSVRLEKGERGFVSTFSAGFVGLIDNKAILITPNDIQLFSNNKDALHNQNELARLELA